MNKSAILLLLLHIFIPCSAYYASSLIKITAKSLDTSSALKQAAETLNVPQSGKFQFHYRLMSYLFVIYFSKLEY